MEELFKWLTDNILPILLHFRLHQRFRIVHCWRNDLRLAFISLCEKRREARIMAAVLLAKLCFRCVVRFSDREYMRWRKKSQRGSRGRKMVRKDMTDHRCYREINAWSYAEMSNGGLNLLWEVDIVHMYVDNKICCIIPWYTYIILFLQSRQKKCTIALAFIYLIT